VGYRVAVSLLEAGYKDIRVGIWKGDHQGAHDQNFGSNIGELLKSKGAEVIDFDWNKEEDYAPALKGVKTVFCTIPHVQGWADAFPHFLKQCKKGKLVEHFVKLSFLRPTHAFQGVAETARQYRQNVPFVAFHGTCDDILEQAKGDSRISFTILCTSHLMSTPLLHQGKILKEEHKFITASYGMGVNYVSPNDVADAAVVVLLNQKPHRNKVYNLTGAKPIRDSDVVLVLEEFSDKPIQHVEMGFHAYAADVKNRGLPDWQVRDSAAFERMKASGIDEDRSSYTRDLETLTGHKPETFREYLSNKSCMRPGLTFP
jgi:NAD(P)H dehydrogenase (quinone)